MFASTKHMTKPVIMSVKEVPRPTVRSTAIIRTPEWTHIQVHPGSGTEQVIEEIVDSLDLTHELGSWISPFAGHTQAVDLRALKAAPVKYLSVLDPRLVRIPCQAHYIPRALQVPWAQL